MEIKTAYEILGVKEGAGRDDIIKRYDILLKKHKILEQDGENDKKVGIEEINKAYNLLMGYDTNEDSKDSQQEGSGLSGAVYRKIGLDEKKVNNFFYYYKYHILITIAVLLSVSYIIYSVVNVVEPDISVIIAGDIRLQDPTKIKSDIKEKLPAVKEVGFQYMYISREGMSQEDQAYTYKITALMTSGDVDIYILDSFNYKKFAQMGAFKNLDALAGQLGIDKEKSSKQIIKYDNEEHMYGIDIGSSSFFKGKWSGETDKIAVIRTNSKHYDNAVKLLKLLADK